MRRIVATAALLVVVAACSGDVPDRGLVPLPEVNVQGMEAVVQTTMIDLRARVDELARDSETHDATLSRAYGELGRHYQVHGMDQAAEVCYRNAAKLTADDFDSAYLLAVVLQEQGKLAEAVEAYDGALALRGDFVPAVLRLAQALAGLDEYARARTHFEEALAAQPQADRVHYPLGLAYRESIRSAGCHRMAAGSIAFVSC